jgi:hypothetical protein
MADGLAYRVPADAVLLDKLTVGRETFFEFASIKALLEGIFELCPQRHRA